MQEIREILIVSTLLATVWISLAWARWLDNE